MTTMDEKLTNPSTYGNDGFYELFAQMRREDPVHFTRGRNGAQFWSLFKHANVKQVLNAPELFSSEIEGMIPIVDEDSRDVLVESFAPGESIIATDPPRHGQLRGLMTRPFMPKALEESNDRIVTLIRRIFDGLPDRGEIDLVDDLAEKIPITVIADMLGVPQDDCAQLLEWGKMAVTASDPEYSGEDAAATTAAGFKYLGDYITSLAMPMRGCPHEGILSTMVNETVKGESLTESEVSINGVLMILAGFETTRNSFSGGLLALLQHPEQMQLLREDPKKIRRAVEEMVRWTSPAMSLMRVATNDIKVGERHIKAGDRVVVWIASANRDEDVFERADQFDITRSPNPHIGFGIGPHTCIGGPLAKIELRIALEELIARYQGIEMIGQPERIQNHVVSGLKRLPIRLITRKKVVG